MRAITKWKADDGSEFNDADSCAKYEALCAEVAAVMAALPSRPNAIEYRNGAGCIQHDPVAFYAARAALLKIANRIMPHRWFDESLADITVHPSWAARLIGEMARPLDRAWYRFHCTDAKLREWGRPFYASNPDKAKSDATVHS